jgi:hypothetical protein
MKALELLYYFKFFSQSPRGLPLPNIVSPDENFDRIWRPAHFNPWAGDSKHD